MGFFKFQHKRLALNSASYDGDAKAIKKAMKEHGKYEYAMLYQNTPKFLNRKRKGK